MAAGLSHGERPAQHQLAISPLSRSNSSMLTSMPVSVGFFEKHWRSGACLAMESKKSREPANGAGDVDTIKALLAAGAEVNQVDASSQWTPLMYAVAKGNSEAAEVLLEAQADVQAQAATGWTALHLAQFLGRSELTARLIEAGASEDVGRSAEVARGHDDDW